MREKLAEELIENLEKANADPEAADEKDFERTRKVEPIPLEDEDED
jgi:hypothetical protein